MENELLTKKGNGYSRESVEAYIKRLDKAFSDKERHYIEEMKKLEHRVQLAEEERDLTRQNLEIKMKEYEALNGVCSEMKEDLRVLHEQNTVLQSEITRLKSDNCNIALRIAHLPALEEDLNEMTSKLVEDVAAVTGRVEEFKQKYFPKEENSDEE